MNKNYQDVLKIRDPLYREVAHYTELKRSQGAARDLAQKILQLTYRTR